MTSGKFNMLWKVGAVLLVSLAVSAGPIEGPECACPFINRPVCGSDGVTYDNDCMLKCLNPSATLEYRGACGDKYVPCVCGPEDSPVCGTNDRTYPNACYLDCDKHSLPNLALKHTGACKEKRSEKKECPCLIIGPPVCASDGQTYESDCEMRCQNPEATVKYNGACGHKEPPPCVCDDIDSPVCGSNDRTYPNECELNCEKRSSPDVALKHTGACKEKRSAEEKLCPCPAIRQPLCASDGRTYGNDCEMECQNPEAKVEYYGACGHREPPPCICDYTDSPVCGSNDRTYPNECELNCEKRSSPDVALKHTGACKEKRSAEEKRCTCPYIKRPLCASDGRTYSNDCEMECQNPDAKVEYYGACGHREPPPCICDYIDSPVCGSNDRTYPNECELNCEKRTLPDLTLASKGACKHQRSVDLTTCACPAILRPVCGSDGVTYDNDCMLKCLNPSAKLEYYGGCGHKDVPCVCSDEYNPVCGTNDRTYPNECDLKCDQTIPNLSVKHTGVCKTKRDAEPKVCACPFIRRPVCGSDGVTYDNDCMLKCRNPDAKLEYYGRCGNREVPCVCPDNYEPVCGTNDITYMNECDLKCDQSIPNLAVKHTGVCKSKRAVDTALCRCTTELNPICGTDGKTYDNPCALNCEKLRNKDENLHILNTGGCKSKRSVDLTDCNCPLRILQQVCGTDGQTYANDCYFDCAKGKLPTLEKAYEGQCGKPNVPCEDCTKAGDQRVCGTNDRSYPNECYLNCEKINGLPNLTVAHTGHCKRANKRSVEPKCACPFIASPVCGSDGVTYPNDCMLKCQNPNAKVKFDGPCKSKRSAEPKLCDCPVRVKKEVCGTDGVTYTNDCFLDCAKRRQPSLAEAHKGPCEDKVLAVDNAQNAPPPCVCLQRILHEVCGTDGVTYANDCFFDCAKSKNRELETAHEGRCDSVAVVGAS